MHKPTFSLSKRQGVQTIFSNLFASVFGKKADQANVQQALNETVDFYSRPLHDVIAGYLTREVASSLGAYAVEFEQSYEHSELTGKVKGAVASLIEEYLQNRLVVVGRRGDYWCFLNPPSVDACRKFWKDQQDDFGGRDCEVHIIPFQDWFRAREVYDITDTWNIHDKPHKKADPRNAMAAVYFKRFRDYCNG